MSSYRYKPPDDIPEEGSIPAVMRQLMGSPKPKPKPSLATSIVAWIVIMALVALVLGTVAFLLYLMWSAAT